LDRVICIPWIVEDQKSKSGFDSNVVRTVIFEEVF